MDKIGNGNIVKPDAVETVYLSELFSSIFPDLYEVFSNIFYNLKINEKQIALRFP